MGDDGVDISVATPRAPGATADAEPVGRAKGPGESILDYVFISPDHDQRLRSGEFVYYCDPSDLLNRPIMGRIVGRRPVRPYPDDFLANPVVEPRRVAELYGFDGEPELFEIDVRTMGYFDERLRTFINPRFSPRVGWEIYLASDSMLASVLNKGGIDETGSVHIGSL